MGQRGIYTPAKHFKTMQCAKNMLLQSAEQNLKDERWASKYGRWAEMKTR